MQPSNGIKTIMQEDVERLARNMGADLCGWAPLATTDLESYTLLPENEPKLYKSAFVFAKRHTPQAVRGLKGRPTPAYDFEYRKLNRELHQIARTLGQYMQDHGVTALAINPSQTLDVQAQKGLVSHKALAVRAGIGVRGRNNLFITHPPYPPVRLCSVLTDIPVKKPPGVDWPYPCDTCENCLRNCPVDAIGETYREYRIDLCLEHLDAVASKNISAQICGACLAVCPKTK
jgi:epoxyqueuosine reductase QueG